MNNAARQQACPSYLPAEARPALQQDAAEDTEGMIKSSSTSGDQAAQHSSAVASAQPVVNVLGKPQSQISNSPTCATAPQQNPAQQKDAGLPNSASVNPGPPISREAEVPLSIGGNEDAAKGVQLEEAEIDWAGDTSLQQQKQDDGDGSPKAEGDRSSWSDADSEEYDPEGALLDIDSHVLSPRPRSSGKKQHGSAQAEVGAHPPAEPDREKPGKASAEGPPTQLDAAPAVQKATLRFVKAILNPLYAAQVSNLFPSNTSILETSGKEGDGEMLLVIVKIRHVRSA